MDTNKLKIERIISTLDDIKERNATAIAHEKLLLNQLKQEFEVDSLEEGKELYNQLIEEGDDKRKVFTRDTNSLYDSMIAAGLISQIEISK